MPPVLNLARHVLSLDTYGGEEVGSVQMALKGIGSVREFGERLAEELQNQHEVEDAFKIYFVDEEVRHGWWMRRMVSGIAEST